ncbi:iron-sulfur cluster assembly accessory protein [Candidatus Woesearchaeota archaeon]|nr:iron-sulfur cluster assembly accessory protein [Candidatus Woesearchaeota archaeon]
MIGKIFGKKEFENPDLVEELEEDYTNNFEDNEAEMIELEDNSESKIEFNGKVTKDTTIGDIVESHPEVIETLTELGVHCVGCHVSPFESLEMGFKGHGMSDEDVEQAVIKLNEVIENSKNEVKEIDDKIHLTRNAAEKIKSLTKNGDKTGLRIHIEKGGCSGYTYEMEVAEKSKGDLEFNEYGVKVFIDKTSFDKLKGSYVDYLDSLQGAGFKIKNPNATTTCGCGESFG